MTTFASILYLNRQAFPMIPPFVNMEGIREQIQEVTRMKDLNIQNSYAKDRELSIKEHMQNWRDQCVVVGKYLNIHFNSIQHLKPFAMNIQNYKAYVYIFENHTIGWIAWKEISPGFIQIELCNCATTLLADEVLVMGRSNKAGTADTAGYFGEGVKVEINRLVSSNVSVSYRTGSSQWEFGYSDRGVLHAHILNLIEQGTSIFLPDTWIEIKHLPMSAFQPEEYLFLHTPIRVVTSPIDPMGEHNNSATGGLQLLLDDCYAGKIYLHGILIMTATQRNQDANPQPQTSTNQQGKKLLSSSPMRFGMNYTGRNELQMLQVGRDRNDVNIVEYIARIPYLFRDIVMSSYPDQIAVLNAFVGLFYDTLQACNEPHYKGWKHRYAFELHTLSYYWNNPSLQLVANALMEEFFTRHGQNAIPMNRDSFGGQQSMMTITTEAMETIDRQQREAELLGAQSIFVGKVLFEWLSHSPYCPTLQTYWEKHAEAILALPEYIFDEIRPIYHVQTLLTFPDEAQRRFAQSIREQINDYFVGTLLGNQICFKDFSAIQPPKNRKRFIPIRVPPSSQSQVQAQVGKYSDQQIIPEYYYIVDIALLTLTEIHTALQGIDARFQCDGQRCGCIQNILIEDILQTLSSKERKYYDGQLRRKVLNQHDTNIQLPVNITSSTSSSIGMETKKKTNDDTHSLSSQQQDAEQPGRSSSSSSLQENQHPTTAAAAAAPLSLTATAGRTGNDSSGIRPLFQDMIQNRNQTVLYCQEVGQNASMPPTTFLCDKANHPRNDAKERSDDETSHYDHYHCQDHHGTYEFLQAISLYTSMTPAPLNSNNPTFPMINLYLHRDSLPVQSPTHAAWDMQLQGILQSIELKLFGLCICLLAKEVFHYPLSHCHLFLANSHCVAFNRSRGQLMFNFFLMDSYFHEEPFATLNYLFPLFCHEYTHNMIDSHDETFASVLSDVTAYHLPAYHAFYETVKIRCNQQHYYHHSSSTGANGGIKNQQGTLWENLYHNSLL